jgi:hypothetical protein
MNLDTPLFQMKARDFFELERSIYGATVVLQIGVMSVGGWIVLRFRRWWINRRSTAAALHEPPPAPAIPVLPIYSHVSVLDENTLFDALSILKVWRAARTERNAAWEAMIAARADELLDRLECKPDPRLWTVHKP